MVRKKPITFAPEVPSYSRDIARPLNQLLIIVPLLVLFQAGSVRLGSGLLVPQYLRVALECLGAPGRWLPMCLIILVLIAQHITRKDPFKLNVWAGLGIIVESACWVLPLVAIGWITSDSPSEAQAATQPVINDTLLRSCIEAIGAGVYEEFLFRMVFISVILMLFVDLLHWKSDAVTIIALIVSGVVFSLFHFSLDQLTGQVPIHWGVFIFLSLAGIWWGVLFLWRGFAVAVCCHIWWDLFVIAWGL